MRKSGLRSGVVAGLALGVVGGVGSLGGGSAWAAPVTLAGIRASKDATLFQDAAGALADGQGPFVYAGKSGVSGGETLRRALMQFDLSTIPTNATITAVALTVHGSQTGFGGDPSVAAHRVTTNWGEGPSTGISGRAAAAGTGDATWVHTFFNTATWTTPGGDFVAAASASGPVSAGLNTVLSSAQMVADVQGWVTTPGQNFGWILTGDEVTSGSAARLDSDESGVAGSRPSLSVTYDVAAVPEPGALAVLAVAPLLLARRRR